MKTYPMVSFRCDTQLHKHIQREAKRQGISIGELIRQAIASHINQETRQ